MRIMLILPCMSWIKYGGNFHEGRFWKVVLDKTRRWSALIDIYAIDCIRLKSTGQMIGLWSPSKDKAVLQEILREELDSYPSWSKYKNRPQLRNELREAVKSKLKELRKRYAFIVSFVNVKAYYNCLQELSTEFDLITLPKKVNWNKARAVQYQNVNELLRKLQEIHPVNL
jgi:hypothetical protein